MIPKIELLEQRYGEVKYSSSAKGIELRKDGKSYGNCYGVACVVTRDLMPHRANVAFVQQFGTNNQARHFGAGVIDRKTNTLNTLDMTTKGLSPYDIRLASDIANELFQNDQPFQGYIYYATGRTPEITRDKKLEGSSKRIVIVPQIMTVEFLKISRELLDQHPYWESIEATLHQMQASKT